MGIAAAMALALVLDTADGRLARLQGTSSAFGRWLDEFLDELVDLTLHAAIAWAAFFRDGRPVWLLLGMAYASGKYLFRVQSSLGDELEGRTNTRPRHSASLREGHFIRRISEVVRLLGHADLRWHLWIVLAAVGRLDVALAAYAAYFPARALGASIRRGWRHA
jgi:phosphatidylglycerophosphate synthase